MGPLACFYLTWVSSFPLEDPVRPILQWTVSDTTGSLDVTGQRFSHHFSSTDANNCLSKQCSSPPLHMVWPCFRTTKGSPLHLSTHHLHSFSTIDTCSTTKSPITVTFYHSPIQPQLPSAPDRVGRNDIPKCGICHLEIMKRSTSHSASLWCCVEI